MPESKISFSSWDRFNLVRMGNPAVANEFLEDIHESLVLDEPLSGEQRDYLRWAIARARKKTADPFAVKEKSKDLRYWSQVEKELRCYHTVEAAKTQKKRLDHGEYENTEFHAARKQKFVNNKDPFDVAAESVIQLGIPLSPDTVRDLHKKAKRKLKLALAVLDQLQLVGENSANLTKVISLLAEKFPDNKTKAKPDELRRAYLDYREHVVPYIHD